LRTRPGPIRGAVVWVCPPHTMRVLFAIYLILIFGGIAAAVVIGATS
jgi:hypothetical protein